MNLPVSCPAMSDLADPATVLAVLVEERRSAVQDFLNSNPVLSHERAHAAAMFVDRAEALLSSLRGFCEACEVVELAS